MIGFRNRTTTRAFNSKDGFQFQVGEKIVLAQIVAGPAIRLRLDCAGNKIPKNQHLSLY
jgi:hypothetical protein